LKLAKVFILLFAAYAFFWNLGAKPLAEWDESRYGQIALEMLRNGDYINYYYNGEPEFWTAKPPLSIWAILISYKIFGFNEFAMRLPATLAGIIALFFLFKFLSLYLNETFVWGGLAIAVTTKSLIGHHLSRSGDTDAFLLAGLFAFLYFFIKFFKNNKGIELVWAALALGLGFMSKGFAIGFYFPVGLFFLFYKSGWRKFFRTPAAYLAMLLFLVFPIAWLTIVSLCGNKDPTGQFGGGSAAEVMIFFDLIGRFTGSIDAGRDGLDLGFLPRTLDIRFGIWWGILCFWTLFALFKFFGNVRLASNYPIYVFKNDAARVEGTRLSLVTFVSIVALLFLSVVKLDWYVAPVLPFFCVLFLRGFELVYRSHRAIASFLCVAGLILGAWNQIRYVSLDETSFPFRDFIESKKPQLAAANEVKVSRKLRQNEMLYLSWVNPSPIKVEERASEYLSEDCKQGVCFLSVP